jgi:hypothetical protein
MTGVLVGTMVAGMWAAPAAAAPASGDFGGGGGFGDFGGGGGFSGGDFGGFFTLDVMPEGYVAALKNAKAGDLIGPFPVEGGFALVRVEEKRQEAPITLEAARPQIVRFLTYDEVRELLETLRSKAKIEPLLGKGQDVPGAPREPASAPPAPGGTSGRSRKTCPGEARTSSASRRCGTAAAPCTPPPGRPGQHRYRSAESGASMRRRLRTSADKAPAG